MEKGLSVSLNSVSRAASLASAGSQSNSEPFRKRLGTLGQAQSRMFPIPFNLAELDLGVWVRIL